MEFHLATELGTSDLAVHTVDPADHAGGWSVDASVTIPHWDRHGLERLVPYCARPPLAQERLGRFDAEHLVYRLRKPTPGGRTELILTPLFCPRCGEPMRIIAFILDPPRVELILTHIGEPVAAPAVLPARGPPQRELGFEPVDQSADQTAWPEIDQSGGQDAWD